ncbi:putative LPS biosynthesis glycosyl transferase protein [Halobacteriovorax marinus SJ]|uniref:LPS biosynthesis glycosyl transferase protein n=1 Tax=Halobacteriovorax marinus (strain ATCC BAA-682 / DSM 15412 / SJ) TaxID=862908 RepID=E1X3U2_HALMS|nr:N-acetyl sugar amidotransferase [Halobacteriovorax marinus]CBW25282.1 putative LPS biosynthesis glycosyl transferase protein [Halobacteriovorax marinus SJ]
MLDSKYSKEPAKMKYCSSCVYPGVSATPLTFDEKGLCSGCRTSGQKSEIDWDRRAKQFEKLINRYKSKDGSNYDCIIPVSGGKDSYFQIHIIKKVYGLNPLLVTYHGNNYTPTGMKNLLNMREAFDVDHIFFTPSIKVLKAMNRIGMEMMGDMNWHGHAGIFTYPIREAVQKRVPLMIWGEHGFMDLGGMHSYNDLVEFTYRYRHEHCLRGYEWGDILEKGLEYGEDLKKSDFIPWMYPTDEEIEDVGVRGIYISNFFKWDANEHGPLMMEKYGFLESEEPFERTYRTMSNLDDMHENGIHDYMKYIKFGYGRATDHVCKDIRSGKMTRKEGIEIVRKMDPIKSKDLYRWLEYVGWSEEKFDEVADRFRDPRVWWKDSNGDWKKHNIWDD